MVLAMSLRARMLTAGGALSAVLGAAGFGA